MLRLLNCAGVLTALLTTAVLSGCAPAATATGSADRSYTVDGPVHLELKNASGETRITAGPTGAVRVHADFRASAWSWDDAQRRIHELQSDPPFSQEGNLVRLGSSEWGWVWPNTSVDYTVAVPPDTELRGSSASGSVNVLGISGPMEITVASGSVSAQGIGGDTRIHAASGSVRLFDIRGTADVTAASGSVDVNKVQGYLRARTVSGQIWIERPAGDVQADAVSGGIDITGATADVRAQTVSGGINIDGNPGPAHFWDINTVSGGVLLRVPSNASFRLYAHSASGHIDVGIPGVAHEGDRHSLQTRIGEGAARVEIGTISGGISIH
jgi:Putative adhesin